MARSRCGNCLTRAIANLAVTVNRAHGPASEIGDDDDDDSGRSRSRLLVR